VSWAFLAAAVVAAMAALACILFLPPYQKEPPHVVADQEREQDEVRSAST
jgi:hypothetical protein